VIDIIQTFMYRRPWPVGTHWPATCDICGHVLPGQMRELRRAAHADGRTFSLRIVNRMFSFAAFFTACMTLCVIRYDHLAMKLGLMPSSGNLISGYGLCFLACMCAVAHSYNAAAATDLRAVRYRVRANWIGPEPDSVLRLVRSLSNSILQFIMCV